MSFYEQRISVDLESIRKDVLQLGLTVESAVNDAVGATLGRDRKLAYETILGDGPINRETEKITADCHTFIARHLPSAGHLRFVSSAIRLVVLFERVGDYAVTICRESVQLSHPLSGDFRARMEEMAADASRMMRHALQAFDEQNQELATSTIAFARQIDREFVSAYGALAAIDANDSDNTELLRRLVIIRQLERVSDQAKNLCEEIVFFLTGETKQRRPARILFLAESDDGFSQMSVAIGRKVCSDRAEFDSAGSVATPEISAEVLAFLSDHGFETDDMAPHTEPDLSSLLERYDVVVILNQSIDSLDLHIPYGKVVLEWCVPDSSTDESCMNDAYRFLRSKIEELVETLRGEGRQED